MTDSEVKALVTAYRNGETIRAIAERHRLHRTTIAAHLDREGIEQRAASRAWSDQDLAQAAAMYANGASLKAIAARYDISPSTVANRFRRAGVLIRARRGWPRPERR